MVSVVSSGTHSVSATNAYEVLYETVSPGIYTVSVPFSPLVVSSGTADTLDLKVSQPFYASSTAQLVNWTGAYQAGTVSSAAFSQSPPVSAPYGFRAEMRHNGSATGRVFAYRVDRLDA